MTAISVSNQWALKPIGNLDAYISSVMRLPMLTLDEEREYGAKARRGDLEASDKLVLSHLKLVVSVARQYLGYGLPHGDLIQEGNVGLIRAVNKFDPDQGTRLANYALYWIKAQIHEYILNNWRMVKIATTKAKRKLFFNLRSMKYAMNDEESKNSGALTNSEIEHISKELNVKREEVIEMEQRFAGGDVPLEHLNDDDDDGSTRTHALNNILTNPNDGPEAALARMQRELNATAVAKAIASLDPRSKRIIEARWINVNDNGIGATLHELAAEFGVSAERIRQIEAAALKKMREFMKSEKSFFA